MQPYTYIFVRTDIPLADQVCQVAHAAMGAANLYGKHDTFLVLLAVPNLEALLEVEQICNGELIQNYIADEPDDNMGQTALATEAIYGDQRQLFKKYRCWTGKIARASGETSTSRVA